MGARRDRLTKRLKNQQKTRQRNSLLKAKERTRREARRAALAAKTS